MEIKVFKKGDKSFSIDTEKVYQIVGKYDADAPDGFKRERTTKTLEDPVVGSTTSTLLSFDSSKNMYDLGMDINSALLRKVYPEEDDRKKAVASIKKNIYDHLVTIYQGETLKPTNFDFWDNFTYTYSLDTVLDARKPIDRFILFYSILSGKLAPTEFSSDPQFKTSAQFGVECKDEVVDISTKRQLDNSKARAKFINLLDEDKEGLLKLLDWIGIKGLDKADEALLNSVFVNWMSKDEEQNTKQFLSVYDEYYKNNSGKKVIEAYTELKKAMKKNLVTVSKEGVLFGDILLENPKDLKQAAKEIASSNTYQIALKTLNE
jgi:hypothetical protein